MPGALSKLSKAAACPTATHDVVVNLRNRQKAIKGAHYGPLNPAEPNTEYWSGIASRWEVTPAEAKKQRCGNCAAFIRTPAMLECISAGLANEPGEDAWATIKAGELGYCEAWDFKCAAGRTCDAWITGGPVLKDIIKAVTKREAGEDFPAEAFAYVPDPEKPSTWKLRLWDSLETKETAAQVGRAVAALGAGGFRGNQVQIPAADLAATKKVVLAAWKKANPDAEPNEAPTVLKGWSDVYEDDGGEEQIDPLDEMLDAYQSFVRMGNSEFADATLALVKEYQTLALGTKKSLAKSEHMGFENPVACLSQAYLGMLGLPGAESIRAKTLKLIGQVSETLFVGMSPEAADSTNYQVAERSVVRREIRAEDGQFCVYSETGRKFGCYANEQQAQNRLAQIESFVGKSLSIEPLEALIEWHDSAHEAVVVTPAIKTVHDLVADEIEAGFGIAEPYQLSTDDKLEIVTSAANSFLNKAAPYRYTLGPAYVPGVEDAHGEFADSETLQKAMWDWVRKGDRTIYLQHSPRPAGEMVEMLTWPFPISTDMTVPGQGVTKQTFPANTPFLGVVWEPWAWELVKAGKLRGYSIGGSAQRIEADLPVEAGVFAKEKEDVPTDMELYNRIKGEAKKKFDVYPSLYANNWLVGEYKRRGGKYKTVEKGDFPGHPYRGNQYDGGGGYGSQYVGTPSPFQVAAGNKVKAMGEDLRTKITQAQKDGEEVGYARVVAMKIREAAVPLKGAYDDPPTRLKETKKIIASAKREYKKLPEGNMKQQIGSALTEIDAIIAKL